MDESDSPQNETAPHLQPPAKKFRRTLSCLSCQKRKVKLQTKVRDLEQRLIKQAGALPTASSTPPLTESSPDGKCTTSTIDRKVPAEQKKSAPITAARRPMLKDLLASSPTPGKLLMEVFVGELINGFSPDPSSTHGRVFDLRSASERRIFSPLLSSGFSAAALIFVGQRDQHLKITAAGNSQYSKMLRLLQGAVNQPEKSKSTEVLTVVVLLTIIEAFKQTYPGAIMKHQLGGLEILRIRTPYRHRSGFERSLFVDLRMFWVSSSVNENDSSANLISQVTTAIASRKKTFLANDDWKTVPWSGDGRQKDILHSLLDIAVDIPSFLGSYDTLKFAVRHKILPQDQVLSEQQRVQAAATELDRRLELWHSLCAVEYEHGYMTETSAHSITSNDEFPRFQCCDLCTNEIFVPTSLIYPDLMLAVSMCLYRALRLVVSGSSDDGLVTVLRPSERYRIAVDICRSMSYYLHAVPGFLVSRIMFVLRVAFDTFTDGMIEKTFVQELFAYIGNKYRFLVFMNNCSESSTAVRADDAA
ncbi:hypothetical protein PISL3812_00061 [Talaromyces islandicus]|uniref:Uncharacterized protein n=1 Tax=Talaromyces islandicus TaxID=28573 RepID=A0A0U1LI77_TALIS|nr:hypothetical protein PISL3812_00061 [Talaromyces islandicus]